MAFIASDFSENEILCNIPPHTLRIDLQSRVWKSDVDPEATICDANDNGIPLEFVLLGFTPYFGNLGMRREEEYIRIAFIGVTPKHRLLPPRCVTSAIISGKTSQKNFLAYFQTLYNNRINCASVITSTKFTQRSFNERDPMTGADGAKINFNTLEFRDRPAQNKDEEQLIEDIIVWMKNEGGIQVSNALASSIPGGDLVELPLGTDHNEIKAQFAATRAQSALPEASSAPQPKAALKSAAVETESVSKTEPPSAKKAVELTAEQAKKLGIDF